MSTTTKPISCAAAVTAAEDSYLAVESAHRDMQAASARHEAAQAAGRKPEILDGDIAIFQRSMHALLDHSFKAVTAYRACGVALPQPAARGVGLGAGALAPVPPPNGPVEMPIVPRR